MRAKLSSTLLGMAVLHFLLLLLVRSPFLRQRLVTRLALQNASSLFDERRCYWFQKDAVGSCLHHALGALLNIELLSQPAWNDHLAFGREPNRICFVNRAHAQKVTIPYK